MNSEMPDLPEVSTKPAIPLPDGACDAHAHIFGPFDRFPLMENRSYTPPEATFESHREMLATAGFNHGVVVQGSAHGMDNRAICDSVQRSEGVLRGIVVIDDRISDAELAKLAADNIVGARFTEIVSKRYVGGMKGVSNFAELKKLAPRLREHGMHAQIFANCQTISANLDMLLSLDLPIVVDHMGRIGPGEWGPDLPEFQNLLSCVREGRFWVKLTALRSSHDYPLYTDARPFHEAFLDANPDHLVFGTDWPMLNLGDRTPGVGMLLDRFHEWTGPAMAEKILVDNPARLYGFG